MKVAVLKETLPSERRVALVPSVIPQLTKAGFEVSIQSSAGDEAGFTDADFEQQGAAIVDRETALGADVLLYVRALGANPQAGREDLEHYRTGQTIIGMCDPLGAPAAIQDVANTGARLFALEMIPRITRAQSMDVLSSMATTAGYRAVLLAANELPKMFPLMMTAAGTLSPVKAFVIGAGVAGLQAIATAKRLGAVVQAYDVRPAVREQVESLGGKFVELALDAGNAEDKGGYAKAMGEEFYQRQRECMADICAENDVVISTAAIPGKDSPLLITCDAVERMRNGSVIVDLAAERGGNCELSQADQRVVERGVTILGPTNLASEIPHDSSQMFAKNVVSFLMNMTEDGELKCDTGDEIVCGTMVAEGGDVVHDRIRELLGLEALSQNGPPPEPTTGSSDDEKTQEPLASDG